MTFFNTKQFLGLEDPRNGWGLLKNRRRGEKRTGPQPRDNKGRKAVERTVPCLFYLYGLVYVWYFENGKPDQDVARARRLAPWYRHKREPSFADILNALRRDLTATTEFFMHPDESRVMQQFTPASEPLMATDKIVVAFRHPSEGEWGKSIAWGHQLQKLGTKSALGESSSARGGLSRQASPGLLRGRPAIGRPWSSSGLQGTGIGRSGEGRFAPCSHRSS